MLPAAAGAMALGESGYDRGAVGGRWLTDDMEGLVVFRLEDARAKRPKVDKGDMIARLENQVYNHGTYLNLPLTRSSFCRLLRLSQGGLENSHTPISRGPGTHTRNTRAHTRPGELTHTHATHTHTHTAKFTHTHTRARTFVPKKTSPRAPLLTTPTRAEENLAVTPGCKPRAPDALLLTPTRAEE